MARRKDDQHGGAGHNLAAIVEGKKAAASSRYITLGDGRKVTLGQYVDAWKLAKSLPPDTKVRGSPSSTFVDAPNRAGDALAEFRAGMDDRINQKDPNFGKGRKWDDAWQNEARRLAETLKRKSEVPSGEAHPVDLRAKIKDRLAPGTTVPAPGGDRSKANQAARNPKYVPGVGVPQDKHWGYKTGPTPTVADLPASAFKGSQKDFESLSPGMRREIMRSAQARAAKPTPQVAPMKGVTPLGVKATEVSPNATARMIGIPKDGSKPFLMAILDSAGDKRQIAERVWNQSAKMHTQPLAGYRIEDKAGNRLHGFQDESTLNAALKAQGKAEKGKAKVEVVPHARGAHFGHNVRGPGTNGEFVFTRATTPGEAKKSVLGNAAKPQTVSDLRAEAKAAGIKGATKMTKSALAKALGKVGAVAMVAAPVTAAVLAYDAKKSEAMAAGATERSATGSAVAAGAIAGGTTAAVGYGVATAITWGVRGAAAAGAAVGAPAIGTAAAVGATALGAYMMAKGAVHGYQKHGVKGAVLGLVGADGLLDRKTTPAAQPVNGRLSPQQAVEFSTANQAFNAMQRAPANSAPMVTEHGRGFANIAVQRAAQKAKGQVYDPARKIAAAG